MQNPAIRVAAPGIPSRYHASAAIRSKAKADQWPAWQKMPKTPFELCAEPKHIKPHALHLEAKAEDMTKAQKES